MEARLLFESKIKRPYFHVKPLDAKQLKNWSAYLDFEIKLGIHERIVVLFERCLIPCAKYEVCYQNISEMVKTCLRQSKKQSKTRKLSQNFFIEHIFFIGILDQICPVSRRLQ